VMPARLNQNSVPMKSTPCLVTGMRGAIARDPLVWERRAIVVSIGS